MFKSTCPESFTNSYVENSNTSVSIVVWSIKGLFSHNNG